MSPAEIKRIIFGVVSVIRWYGRKELACNRFDSVKLVCLVLEANGTGSALAAGTASKEIKSFDGVMVSR